MVANRHGTFEEMLQRSGFAILSETSSSHGPWSIAGREFEYLAIRPDYSFLQRGVWKDNLLRVDFSAGDRSYYYRHRNRRFIARAMDHDCAKYSLSELLTNTRLQSLQGSRFERVGAVLFGAIDRTGIDLLIHDYSGGVELLTLQDIPRLDARKTVSTALAGALAELHGTRIIYSLATPTMIRYHLRLGLLFSPHAGVRFDVDDDDSLVGELALVTRTNPWLMENEEFLTCYLRAALHYDLFGGVKRDALRRELDKWWDWIRSDGEVSAELSVPRIWTLTE